MPCGGKRPRSKLRRQERPASWQVALGRDCRLLSGGIAGCDPATLQAAARFACHGTGHYMHDSGQRQNASQAWLHQACFAVRLHVSAGITLRSSGSEPDGRSRIFRIYGIYGIYGWPLEATYGTRMSTLKGCLAALRCGASAQRPFLLC
eukprot:363299-Chlamydomonas_euryale.AAC.1